MNPALQLQTFTFATGMNFRAIVKNGAPWFIATDVAKALGYRGATALTRSLDADEKGVHQVCTLGGVQTVTIITEPALYKLLFRSDKPEAKAITKWVAATVMPSMREHGGFVQGVQHLPQEEQAALYAGFRQQAREAMRLHDKATAHDHWVSTSKRAERSRLASREIAQAIGLPLAVVHAVASQGLEAGVALLVAGRVA